MNDGEMFGRTLRVNFAKPMKISEGSTRPVWARYDRAGYLIVLVTTFTLLVVTSGCRSMPGPVSPRAPPAPTRRTRAWCPPRTAARRGRGRRTETGQTPRRRRGTRRSTSTSRSGTEWRVASSSSCAATWCRRPRRTSVPCVLARRYVDLSSSEITILYLFRDTGTLTAASTE